MNAPNYQFRQRRSTSLPDAPRQDGKLRLGDVLIRDGTLRPDQVAEGLKIQSRSAAPLGEILTSQNMLSKTAVTRALAKMCGTTTVDLDRDPPDARLPPHLSAAQCLAHSMIPWRKKGGTTLIASSQPDAASAILRQLPESLRPARVVVASPEALNRAIKSSYGPELTQLAESRTPLHQSCREWTGQMMGSFALVLALVSLIFLFSAPWFLGSLLFWLATMTLAINTTLKAACVWLALRRHARPSMIFKRPKARGIGKLPKISILIPLFKEANVAVALIDRLGRIDYPTPLLEMFLVVEADDTITRKAIERAALPPTIKVITVPAGQLKTKPRAMNYALDFTTGSIVGIYDAEDAPDRDQLYRVARKFQESDEGLACVQGVLSFYNPRAGWLARCFTFEYAGWFRVMLPGLQKLGFAIPLGGTTLFFKRQALMHLGGWDAHNVTEDADLGIRLARYGYRCEMLATVTEEEANNRFWPWVRQRSRWLKGYAMTYCVHMRAPVQLWRDLGAWKFLGFQILFVGTLLAFCLAPVLWWNMAFFLSAGLIPPVVGLSMTQIYGLSLLFMLCEVITFTLFFIAGRKLEHRPALWWICTLPVYFAIGTLAAYKGVAEMISKPFYWDKTEHGLSTSEMVLQVPLSVNFQASLERGGEVVSQSSGGGDRVPRLDGFYDSEVLIKRD